MLMSNACWRFGASTLVVMTAFGSPMVQSASGQSVDLMTDQLPNAEVIRVSDLRAMSGTLPIEQVTNVNELRDVQPDSWAYEALKSLVERYGCIVGYPDRTFRGDRPLSRYEFAAGLNACLTTMERLLQENVAVVKEDIEKLQRLAQDFKAELAALGTRIDNLETRVAYLEDHQFSTTTKLFGVTTMYVAGAAGDKTAASYIPSVNGVNVVRPAVDIKDQAVMQYSTLLSLNTSFTGTDNLSVDLWTSNVTPFSSPIIGFTENVTGTYQTRLSYDAPPYNNSIGLADLI